MIFQISVSYYGIRISILPQGHALMSILIAYLGVSKVNQAYDRYMSCRIEFGRAMYSLRELNQYCITMTEGDLTQAAFRWRKELKRTILQLIQSIVTMVKNSRHAQHLATGVDKDQEGDPFELINYLRSHMYNGCKALPEANLQVLELGKMLDVLHEFTQSYRELVRLASTPIPFALVQMGRTFMFIWVLSLPLVLSGEDFNDMLSVFIFVVLLTYGFLGLEVVSMILSNPFGDEAKSALDVKNMAKATVAGIGNDSRYLEKFQSQRKKEKNAKSYFFSERILSIPQEYLDEAADDLDNDEKPNTEQETILTPIWESKFTLPGLKFPDSMELVTPYLALTEHSNSESTKTSERSPGLSHKKIDKAKNPDSSSSNQAAKKDDNSDHNMV